MLGVKVVMKATVQELSVRRETCENSVTGNVKRCLLQLGFWVVLGVKESRIVFGTGLLYTPRS